MSCQWGLVLSKSVTVNLGTNTFWRHGERVAKTTGDLLRSPYGLWGLGLISFVESALVLPIITDPFLVVYILANRRRTVWAIIVTTLTSVAGGVAAYIMAVAFFEFISAHYLAGAAGEQFYRVAHEFQDNTFILTIYGSFTPIPYTIIALVVGFVKGNLLVFILTSIVGRGVRYVLVGYLTARFGERALSLARRKIHLITLGVIVATVLYLLYRVL